MGLILSNFEIDLQRPNFLILCRLDLRLRPKQFGYRKGVVSRSGERGALYYWLRPFFSLSPPISPCTRNPRVYQYPESKERHLVFSVDKYQKPRNDREAIVGGWMDGCLVGFSPS